MPDDLQSTDTWKPSSFFKAICGGVPTEQWGYERRGLVMHHSGWATPRTATLWTLTHVGSGAAFLRLTGNVATVMPVAGEIVEASDWTIFDLPEGWRQTDPDLPGKIGAICEAHPEVKPDSGFAGKEISDADARAVIEARETVTNAST